jgi:hypothetical protein
MSKSPIDKRRARQTKRPWYVDPITHKVIVLLLRVAMKVIDLFE